MLQLQTMFSVTNKEIYELVKFVHLDWLTHVKLIKRYDNLQHLNFFFNKKRATFVVIISFGFQATPTSF